MESKRNMEKSFNNYQLEKRLIYHVRCYPILYDNCHKHFTNVQKKQKIWQKIATSLRMEVDVCQSLWIDLRYQYQEYVRRLRTYFRNGYKLNKRRPIMKFENELLFLYNYIDERKMCKIPFDITIPESMTSSVSSTNQEDDLIIVEEPIELIVIDEDDDNFYVQNNANVNQSRMDKLKRKFHLTVQMKQLIENIKLYPALYDSQSPHFNDANHKGYIWNEIAVKMLEKATKLMKLWIIMQTRFEWAINLETPLNTELETCLAFFKPYILANSNTAYKQSHFLMENWYEPIDNFKNIQNLLIAMKKYLSVIPITERFLYRARKSTEFLKLWFDIANEKRLHSPGECETTWLILRLFYWELKNMREKGYQLSDKWYFENIIDELYQQALKLPCRNIVNVQFENPLKKQSIRTFINQQKKALSSSSPSSTNNNVTNNATINLVNSNSPIDILDDVNTTPLQSQQVHQPEELLRQQGPLPMITSAISLNGFWNSMEQRSASPLQQVVSQMSNSKTEALRSLDNNLNSLEKTVHHAELNTPETAFLLPESTIPNHNNNNNNCNNINNNNNCNNINNNRITNNNIGNNNNTNIDNLNQILRNEPLQIMTTSSSMSTLKGCAFTKATLNTNSETTTVTTIPISILTSLLNPRIQQEKTSMVPTVTTVTNASITSINNNNISGNRQAIAKTATVTTIPSINPTAMLSTAATATTATATTSTIITTIPTPIVASPKARNAVTTLNANEILIELIASSSGNLLVIQGPALSERYTLTMSTTVEFIRQVMAIPLLHNKKHNQPALINSYWHFLSQEFNLPLPVCRACWNFLLANFNQFPKITSMKELMKPFHTKLNVWTYGNLFNGFDTFALSKGWLNISRLPEIMECISTYPVLYKDLTKNGGNQLEQNDMESHCVWRTICLRFPEVEDIPDIWKAFKMIFLQYIKDIEFGINNQWPLKLWRILAKMKFLVETCYSNMEPFYYIVHNKILDEIERCAMLEMLSKYDDIKELKSTNEIVTTDQWNAANESNFDEPSHSNCNKLQSDKTSVIGDQVNQSDEVISFNQSTKRICNNTLDISSLSNCKNLQPDEAVVINVETNCAGDINPNKGSIKRTYSTAMGEKSSHSNCKKFLLNNKVDEEDQTTSANDKVNESTYNTISQKGLKDIEAIALLNAINKRLIICNKLCDPHEKYEAWKNVAKEFNVEVTDCMLAFRRAICKYRAYKHQDPLNRCHLNQRYYAKYNELYRSIVLQQQSRRQEQQQQQQLLSLSLSPSLPLPSSSEKMIDIEEDGDEENKINTNTPEELEQSINSILSESPNAVFPERYIADIHLYSCPIKLVVKNWAYALDNITTNIVLSKIMKLKIKMILRKFISDA